MPTTACLPPPHASPFHPGGSSGTSSRLTYLVVVLLDSLIGEGGPAPGELLRTKLPVVRSSTTAPNPRPRTDLGRTESNFSKNQPLRGPHSAHAQYQPAHLLSSSALRLPNSGRRSHTWRNTSLHFQRAGAGEAYCPVFAIWEYALPHAAPVPHPRDQLDIESLPFIGTPQNTGSPFRSGYYPYLYPLPKNWGRLHTGGRRPQ
jgi:hypothetical protein